MMLRWIALFGLLLPGLSLAGPLPAAPEFSQRVPEAWINSPPLRIADLRGDVLLIEFWTFACASCVRSVPWVKAMEERFRGRRFKVIGIHTPEFSFERSPRAVARQMRVLGIRHPVMLDNDYAYWNAMGNRAWPAYYLVDRQGRLRHAQFGEMRQGDPAARQLQGQIEALLPE